MLFSKFIKSIKNEVILSQIIKVKVYFIELANKKNYERSEQNV